MDRWYSVEERASEIAAVEHSKKKGGERVKALRPRSLLKAPPTRGYGHAWRDCRRGIRDCDQCLGGRPRLSS
jgi:hypothetical protein